MKNNAQSTELQLFTNELFKIQTNEQGQKLVSAK